LASLEAELFLLGHWKNFEDIEDTLTLDELQKILEAAREKDHNKQRFAAALQGVDLDKDKKEDTSFDEVKRRAQSKISGVSEEELGFADIGITVVEE